MEHKELIFNEFSNWWQGFKDRYYATPALLDVGAGDGYHVSRFKNELNIQSTGMDIFKGNNVVIKGRMEDIPFHNNSFDIVFSCHSFEHTIDPIKTLKEFHRVLMPNGILFLVTPYYCLEQLYTTDDTHTFVFDSKQLAYLLKKNRFEIMDNKLIQDGDKELDWQQIIVAVKI